MLTAVVTVLVSLVPGALLALAVPAGVHRWVTLAAAPVLTLGLTSTGMAWLGLVHLPDSAQAVFAFEIVLALLAVAASHLWRRRSSAALAEDPPGETATVADPASAAPGLRRRLPGYQWALDAVSFVVPAAIAVGFGRHILGPLAYPPGWDAMNHGILTRNIVNAGSTAISSACVTGSTHPVVACTFYPLATDVNWAQGAVLSGGHISTAMLVWCEVVGPLALVAAIYAAVRVLGGRPLMAGAAGVAATFLGPVWAALLTGRPPEAFGPAFAVSVAVLALLALRRNRPIESGVLAGIGVGGIVMTHTYDVLFAVVLTIAFALVGARGLRWSVIWRGIAGMVAGLIVSLAPLGSAIADAGGERTAHNPAFVGHLAAALRYFLVDSQRYIVFGYPSPDAPNPHHSVSLQVGLVITLICFAASPLCLVFRQLRWARPWFGAWVVWTAIVVWTSTSNSSAARGLASLWYGIRERERVMVAPLYPVLVVAGACGIGLAVQWCAAALARRTWRVRPLAIAGSAAALLVAASVVGVAAVPASRATLQRALVLDAPRGNAYPATFKWLAEHTPKGDVVAYDRHRDFITWSFVNEGVPLLFGMAAVKSTGLDNTNQRTAAWDWLVDNPDATPADGCLVRKFRVAYLVTGKQHVPFGGPAAYRPSRVRTSPKLQLVHVDGGLKVYAVTPAGRACGTAA